MAKAAEKIVMPDPSTGDYWPLGMRVYGRKGTKFSRTFGKVVGTKDCTLEGCRGLRLGVRWPNGRLTWPCTKGLIDHPKGMQIG